jgi:hypothetical protein
LAPRCETAFSWAERGTVKVWFLRRKRALPLWVECALTT